MKKIVIFDTWLNGLRFVDFLPERYNQYTWIFLHCSSLFGNSTNDSVWPGELRDLKEWNYNITRTLKDLKPDKVLVISIHNYEQRILINICNQLGIPVDFYPHGIRVKEKIIANGNRSFGDYIYRFFIHANRLYKLLNANRDKYIFVRRLRILYSILFNYNFFKNSQIESLPIHVRRTALNSIKQKEFFINDWNLKDCEYYLTNNVKNLFDAIRCEDDDGIRESVLFIGQPLYGEAKNYIFYFEEFAKVIRKRVSAQIIYRPHPSQQYSFTYNSDEIFTVSSESIYKLMGKVKFVVGVNSAMLYLAELLNIPRCILCGVDKIDFPDLLPTDLVINDIHNLEARFNSWYSEVLDDWSYEKNNFEKYWNNWQSFISD